jgi:DNA ligase (NAD+)
VTRASLFNADELLRLSLRPGDRVTVRRAGDVIPVVVGLAAATSTTATTDAADGTAVAPFALPQQCPACGGAVARVPGEAVTRCVAGLSCPAQALEHLVHFASRDALDVQGLGRGALSSLYAAELVRTPLDVFALRARTARAQQQQQQQDSVLTSAADVDSSAGTGTSADTATATAAGDSGNGSGGDISDTAVVAAAVQQQEKPKKRRAKKAKVLCESTLADLPGWGDVKAMKLLQAIDSAREVSLARFICALGVRHVGVTTAAALAQLYSGSFDAWWSALTAAAAATATAADTATADDDSSSTTTDNAVSDSVDDISYAQPSSDLNCDDEGCDVDLYGDFDDFTDTTDTTDTTDITTSSSSSSSSSSGARQAFFDTLAQKPGLGPVMAESLLAFARAPSNRELVAALAQELTFIGDTTAAATDTSSSDDTAATGAALAAAEPSELSGKRIVITGTLQGMTRGQAKQLAAAQGAVMSAAISSKTDIIVVGQNPGGAKLQQCAQLQLRVVSEDEWNKLIKR